MDTDQLTDPRTWRMVAEIERRRLTAMLYSTTRSASREMREYPLSDDGGDGPWLRSLEEAVYDHSLMLSDFDRVSLIIDTHAFSIIPAEAASHAETLFAAAFPDEASGMTLVRCPLGVDNAMLVMGLRNDVAGFLRRTFPEAGLWHRLAITVRFFAARSSAGGNGSRLYAILRGNAVDIVALDRNRLLGAMTHQITEPIDAAYYIMATLRRLGLDPMADELFIGGDTDARNAAMGILRNYVNHVMPVILPASAGNDPIIPFDLKILPLCE